MRVHDCPYRVVNSDHMQISFEAKIIRSFYDCCFVEGSLARTRMSLRDLSGRGNPASNTGPGISCLNFFHFYLPSCKKPVDLSILSCCN